MNVASAILDVEFRHFHLFCGLGGGAKGFNRGQARVGSLRARFRCIGGVDVDPAAVRDFSRAAGVPGTALDLFSRDQYRAFHDREPPATWREATPADLQRAAGGERPHIVFLSAPCKGFSGLLPEASSKSAKYQALTRPSYAIEAHHALFSHGQPIAVAAAGETVRETVGNTGLARSECVELARLCASGRHLCPAMLRLWREIVFPALAAVHDRPFAVSYQDRRLHTGGLYRYDGWILIGRGGGGGPDSRTGRPGRDMNIWGWAADEAGRKRLRAIGGEP